MSYLKDLKRELKEQDKEDKRTNGIMVAKEQAIFKDLKDEYKKCQKCGRENSPTLDHIIPVSQLRNFIDVKREILEGNYQLLCYPCNIFKADKYDFSIPETKQLLLTLLKDV